MQQSAFLVARTSLVQRNTTAAANRIRWLRNNAKIAVVLVFVTEALSIIHAAS